MAHPVVAAAIELFLAQTESRYLRTVYINPTFAVNGDGTTWTQAATPGAAGAFNAWGTGTWVAGAIDLTHFWRDQTRYLQAAETQVNNVVVYTVTAGPMVGILMGTHDPATGAQIRDNTRHARIWSASGKGIDFGTAGTTRQNFVVDNIDCRALARTTSSGFNYGFTNAAAAIDTYAGITLIRCIADGYVAVTLKGKDLRLFDCKANGYADAYTLQSVSVQALGNRLFEPAEFLPIDATTYDSFSQEIVGAFTTELARVEYNDFTKPVPSDKQCVYLYCGGGTNANTPTGPVTIRHNKVSNGNQAIYSALDNTEVAYNWVDQAWNHNDPDGGGAGDARAIAIVANNAFVHDNLTTNSQFASGITFTSTAGTHRVHRNTFDGVERGFTATSGTWTLDWRDNVVVRSPQTLQPDTDCLYVKTVSSITLNASGNLYYGTADPANAFFVASTYKNFATYKSANEPTAQFAVPGYDATHCPTPGGNLAGQGGTGGGCDINGRAREYPTSIGAFEYVRARPTRTLP